MCVPIMIRRTRAIVFLLAALLTGIACSEPYSQTGLGPNSKAGEQIARMLEEVRSAGVENLDQIIASAGSPGLTGSESSRLHAALDTLALAKSARLVSVDGYGDRVIRAGFEITDADDKKATIFMLFVDMDQKLYWAGPN